MPQPEGFNVASPESHLREQVDCHTDFEGQSMAQVRMKQYEDQHRSKRVQLETGFRALVGLRDPFDDLCCVEGISI